MTEDLLHKLRTAYDRKATERDHYGKEPWKLAQRADFVGVLQQERKRTLLELGAGVV